MGPGVAAVGGPVEAALADRVAEAEVLEVVVEVAGRGEPDVLRDREELVDVVDDGVAAVVPGLAAVPSEVDAAGFDAGDELVRAAGDRLERAQAGVVRVDGDSQWPREDAMTGVLRPPGGAPRSVMGL